MPEEYEKKVAAALEMAGKMIKETGTDIGVVGEMVLKAVRENTLYIHTDRSAEDMINTRFKAILEALPVSNRKGENQ
jgi:hypothetical protein